MSLADDLNTLAVKPHKQCMAGLFIGGLPDPDRDALLAALRGQATTVDIFNTLAAHRLTVSFTSLGRHRRTLRGQPGGCSCDVG